MSGAGVHRLRRRARRLGAAGCVLFCAAAVAQPAAPAAPTAPTAPAAPAAPAEAAIREALTGWMADFNARRADVVCALFAPDLRYDYRGLGERDYRQMCSGLQAALTDPARSFRYALEIKDIMVSGELAVARVLWALTMQPRTALQPTVTHEHSLDVFRRQADGSWKMTRFVAYDAP